VFLGVLAFLPMIGSFSKGWKTLADSCMGTFYIRIYKKRRGAEDAGKSKNNDE
jgi:hypothetical protein